MKAAVVTFPGSNCDHDLYHAVKAVGGDPRFVWHRDRGLDDVDVVFLSGGFSYGDYLRAGAIARFSPIMDDVLTFARAGGPVAGICNGFQVLCEAGLLPGALIRNASLKFQSENVRIRVERSDTVFTSDYEQGAVLQIPSAHAEGNYRADADTVERLEGEGRVLFRYVDRAGEASEGGNPNGSVANIAGIVDEGGRVMGMMPHPERAMDDLLGSRDGRGFFTSLLSALTGSAA